MPAVRSNHRVDKDFFGLRDAIATRSDVFTRGLTEFALDWV
jgi:hypothetical protein